MVTETGKLEIECNGAPLWAPELTVGASCKGLGLFSADGRNKLTLIKIGVEAVSTPVE